MAFDDLIRGLRETEQHLAKQLEGVRTAMSALTTNGASAAPKRGPGRPSAQTIAPAPVRKRGKLSAKGRAAIARAQRLRWAKQRAAQK